MFRYRAASENILSGVLIISSMGWQNSSPKRVRSILSAPHEKNVVVIAVFISPYFLAPNSCEITTEQPILHPMAIAINIIVMG